MSSKVQSRPGLEKVGLGQEMQRLKGESTDHRQRQRDFTEEFRQAWQRVAAQILPTAPEGRPWALGVTSATHGEGRTTSSIGLATALAQETAAPVVLVEADLAKPALAQIFRLTEGWGLNDYLRNDCGLHATLAPSRIPNLTILPACVSTTGAIPDQFSYLLRLRLPKLLAALREQFSYLVFDLPPLLQAAVAGGMASELEGVLLVARSGVTRLPDLQESSALLGGTRLVATVHITPPSSMPAWAESLLRE